jgi:hypothetical protein
MDDNTRLQLSNPEFFSQLIANVTSGGSLPNICSLLKIQYHRVIEWIYADETRSRSYERALTARAEWFIQGILGELKDIAMADIRLLYDDEGNLLPPKQWPEHMARVVQAVESVESQVDPTTTKRVKMWDKLKAIELLGKNLKMFKDQLDIGVNASLEDLVIGSLKEEPDERKAIEVDATTNEETGSEVKRPIPNDTDAVNSKGTILGAD